jgi:phage-related baseplate assembly protein
MSRYTAIDLSQLGLPDAVEALDFETILANLKAGLSDRMPELAPVLQLESEPLVKLLEEFAYALLHYRARVNDGVKAVSLATATGGDLDHFASRFGVERLTVTPADDTTNPPTAAVMETDADLRARTQLALEGFSTAGPRSAYEFHARSADAAVKDVVVLSPSPGLVRVVVLSEEGNGVADAALLDLVRAAVNDDDVRPLCDTVEVTSATIVTYDVTANLEVADGPDTSIVEATAQAALEAYVANAHGIGVPIALSGIFAALHQSGVLRVTVSSPLVDLEVGEAEAAYCTGITLTVEVAS